MRGFASGKVFGEYLQGQGGLILLLHGWARTSGDFVSVTNLISQSLRAQDLPRPTIVSLDLPGFGASPAPIEPVGSDWYAKVLTEVIDEVGAEASTDEVVVVGHSLGGRVLVHYASSKECVATQVVLVGAPLIRLGGPGTVATRLKVAKSLSRLGLVSDRKLNALRDRYGSTDYRATSGVMRSVFVRLVNEDYRPMLKEIVAPVTLVSGELDTTVPPEVARLASELLPMSHSVTLSGVGHLIPTSAPDRLADLIVQRYTGAEN